jgi:TrmH family RNA methyltransferase
VARRLRRLGRRREPGEVLLEGPRVVTEAAGRGVPIEWLVLREGATFDVPAQRRAVLGPRLFDSLSQTVTTQGVMALGRWDTASPAQAVAAARQGGWPLVVLDGVQDPGNVGAICRVAAAAGAPAVACLEGTADPLGPKAIRGSAGVVFGLVVARTGWEDLAGLDGYGASARGGEPLEAAPIEAGGLLVLGSEAHGLRREDLRQVSIPLAAGVESLNVATAAALLLFEIRRRKAA